MVYSTIGIALLMYYLYYCGKNFQHKNHKMELLVSLILALFMLIWKGFAAYDNRNLIFGDYRKIIFLSVALMGYSALIFLFYA